MRFVLWIAVLQLTQVVAGQSYTVDPPTTAPGNTILDCTNWHVGATGDSCQAIATQNFIELRQLYRYQVTDRVLQNPSLADGCNIVPSTSYCVEENWGIPPPEPTTTSSTSTTTTTVQVTATTSISTGGNGIATPSPTQPPSIAPNCNSFYFVKPQTSCATVLADTGLTLAQLFAWNSGILSDCSGLWANVWLCAGVIGGNPVTTTPTPSVSTTSTSTGGNGIATPSPTQPPSIVSNCNKFYFVPPNTGCDVVLRVNGISQKQLFMWNSGVGADCSGLWANVWVCVGVIGGPSPTITTSSTTTRGNGIATPTPTQPGMVNNCKTFYKGEPLMLTTFAVVEGDDCGKISSKTGVSVSNIQRWNTELGGTCSVWLGYYLCIGV
ncbi:hypothetical protein B0I35DRAFT_401185 [Stachybotrys elegans]|uniref:LysM domain-containing protein n=1 Tax=Stachybotrys elegans TaxID=80388 RepID=A0A8K0WLE7_9HYPO|nr:hypothetical protein B0I35DRAFT_401185 [Stachybotrys elegans]